MLRHQLTVFLILLFLMSSCKEFKNYESGGFGSINGGAIGNSSSLVTISGRVMSTATFNSFESQSLGAEGLTAFRTTLQSIANSSSHPTPLITTYAGVDSNDCSGARWTMSYVGGGGSSLKSGTAAVDGTFEVPSVPQGKEGLMIFYCGSSTQKCLVKGGDESVSCNSIADGVVGALESTLGKDLTNVEFAEKTVSKVASAIVEASNSDSADAETLKNAVSNCKIISNEANRKNCYKNSIMSSGQSANFEVVKTLAQDWNVPRLFNFLVGSMGISIEIDNFIYTPLGEQMDIIFETNFILKTKEFIQDLINNPEYVLGDSTKGEQTVKIECIFDYVKPGRGGSTSFKPEIDNAGIPHCATETPLRQFTGIQSGAANDGKLLAFLSAIQNSSGNSDTFYQLGSGTPEQCNSNDRWNIPGNFCLRIPKIFIKSKLLEPDRNDPEGTFGTFKWEDENKASLVKPSSAVQAKADQMVNTSNSVASSDPLYQCFTFGAGAPVINNTPACKSWVAAQLAPLKTEFRGLIGVYMFLTNPSTYGLNQNKLSLNDIHAVFTKQQFLNSKLLVNSSGAFGEVKFLLEKLEGGMQDIWLPPVLDVNSSTHPFVPNLFLRQPGQNGGRFLLENTDILEAIQMNTNGDLSGSRFFNLTFGPFLNIPTTSQIKSFVQYESRHQPWNPFGDQYYDIPAVQINVGGPNKKFPIYCRLLNRHRLDSNNNPIPMVKQLNPSTLIECLANPTSAGVSSGSSEGDYNYSSANFSYPFILQSRGFQGDTIGQLFTLIDRKSGQQVRVGGSEIMVLQAHSGNTSIMVQGSCGDGFNEPTLTSEAPLIKAQFTYGTGSFARSEIVSAYCLNFSSIQISDNNTIPYTEGSVSVSMNGNSWTTPALGGRLTTSSSFDLKQVCLFASTFSFSQTKNSNKYTTGFATTPTATITSSYSITYNTNQGPQNNTGNELITALSSPADFVDFCDQSHPGTTKYYLSPSWDNTARNVTLPTRGDVPFQIINSNNTLIQGVYISLGALEDHYPTPTLKVANSAGRTWFHNTKLLNKKYNAKFDPYCDDRNNNGKCDCNTQDGSIKSGQCNLGDFAAEPTLSRPPYWKNQDNASQFLSFFNSYGGKSGAELAPLNGQYFQTNNLHMRLEDIMFCQYRKTNETTYRRPTQYIWGNFANTHFPGCPNASGEILNFDEITDSPKTWHPTEGPSHGGGPVRIIRPREMNNSFSIAYPKKFTTILNYATKSIGQGVKIDPTKKLFSFDEAVALIEIRRMLQPQLDEVYDSKLVYNEDQQPLDGVSPGFISVSMDPDSDRMDTPSAVFLGLTRPSLLTAP